jgi:16S rRNA (uracil1498-N3)-methyltransferase
MPKRQQTRRRAAQSNTYRFFVQPDALLGREFALEDGDLAHQLGTVLRLGPGDHVVLLDNSGWQFDVVLTRLERSHIRGTVERKELAGGEPRTKITLYTALMRPERFEWVLQKGTELGVAAFVPLICERSMLADADELSERKLERWSRIIREAAEQARRGKLPRLAPALFFGAACEQAARRGPALLLWEGEGAAPLRQALRAHEASPPPPILPPAPRAPLSVAVFSGPEGGLSHAELETARGHGLLPVTLGPRTMRAETAPIVAAAAILYEMGDMG